LTFIGLKRNLTLVDTAFRHLSTTMADIRYDRISWTVGVALLAMLLCTFPAQAQQDGGDDPYSPRTTTQSDDNSSVGLPSWAEPGTSSKAIQPPDNTPTGAPPPPPPPAVPVDGGIGFLALAGAGYAVSRLRKSASDDDNPPLD
jgi:hypothetical protein